MKNGRPIAVFGLAVMLGAAAAAQPAPQLVQGPDRAMYPQGQMMGSSQMMSQGGTMADSEMRRQMAVMIQGCQRMMSTMGNGQRGQQRR